MVTVSFSGVNHKQAQRNILPVRMIMEIMHCWDGYYQYHGNVNAIVTGGKLCLVILTSMQAVAQDNQVTVNDKSNSLVVYIYVNKYK